MENRLFLHHHIYSKLCYKKYSERFHAADDNGSVFYKGIHRFPVLGMLYFLRSRSADKRIYRRYGTSEIYDNSRARLQQSQHLCNTAF